jgi:hypothetical protein
LLVEALILAEDGSLCFEIEVLTLSFIELEATRVPLPMLGYWEAYCCDILLIEVFLILLSENFFIFVL